MRSRFVALVVVALLALLPFAESLAEVNPAEAPFAKLAGRWVGEGRLGIKDARPENVKCRVTYALSDKGRQAKQTIRCASPSGHVEVQSTLIESAGVLTGTWIELTREWTGELAGAVTPHGFKVAVKGNELNANMDIILKGGRQVIEIQFIGGALIGMTLVLKKG